MPRPKSLFPTTRITAYISEENAAKVNLLCYDTGSKRFRFNAVSTLVNDALSLYFKRQEQETWTQKLASLNSALSRNNEG